MRDESEGGPSDSCTGGPAMFQGGEGGLWGEAGLHLVSVWGLDGQGGADTFKAVWQPPGCKLGGLVIARRNEGLGRGVE